MSKVLLVNPSNRPARRKARKAASPAQRRARAAFAAAARSRRKNPARRVRRAAPRVHHVKRRAHVRRRNPIHALAHRRTHRRRRNPISMGVSTRGIVAQLKHALIGGAGAVGIDLVMGQLNKYLPASMQSKADSIGLGDAVKVGVTVILGQVLRKATRGMSTQLAQGALIVQAADIMRSFVPSTMTVGYFTPGRVLRATPRVGPNQQFIAPGFGKYMRPGSTQLLSRYMSPGQTQLLNASGARTNSNVRMR